jgi:hypothetical protein
MLKCILFLAMNAMMVVLALPASHSVHVPYGGHRDNRKITASVCTNMGLSLCRTSLGSVWYKG